MIKSNTRKEVKMEHEFNNFAVCKRKIGMFRRRATRKQDASGKFPIMQSQFCSPKCAKLGYSIFLEVKDTSSRERQRAAAIIDSAMKMIEVKRGLAIRKYGYLNNIPPKEYIALYPGATKLLQRVKEKILNETQAN